MSMPGPTSSSAFLGVGWSFPVALDDKGLIEQAEYEKSVAQSIWLVLATSPGERQMRPDYGCGIYDLVFAPATTSTYSAIEALVSSALLRFEPRIEVLKVSTAP